jgi:hypothetical protein
MGLKTQLIVKPDDDYVSRRDRNMVVTFITQDQEGIHTYTGHVVSRGPSTIVVMLTEPFSMAGRSVQFPMTTVVEEKVVSA